MGLILSLIPPEIIDGYNLKNLDIKKPISKKKDESENELQLSSSS